MADAPKPPAGEAAKPGPMGQGGSMNKEMGKRGMADDADDKPKRPMPKPAPSSGRHIGRGLMIASLLITVAWIVQARFSERFQLVPVQNQENTFMYRLDTFSGAVHFCTAQQCVELPVKGPP